MLQLDGITSTYGRIEALRDVSLTVGEGEIVCLIGGNGAGKTTTLMSICGIKRITKGKVTYNGKDISDTLSYEIVKSGISQVPEGRRIFHKLTVLENLKMGGFLRAESDIWNEVEMVFELFPILKERSAQIAGTLSGGEQQMLAIGRALVAKPRLLLLDEPSLGLAPQIVNAIFKVILEINRKGATILLVEQNVHIALTVAKRGYVMETGKIILEDTPENLLKNEDVRRAYLGEA